MKNVVGSAPGKIILTGEHSVVYGETALLVAVGLRGRVKAELVEGNSVRLYSEKLGAPREMSLEDVRRYWQKARAAWKVFDADGKSKELEELRKDGYVMVVCAAGKCLEEQRNFSGGLDISLESDLPVGVGFGSSANAAALVLGGLGRLFGKKWSLDEINQRVFEVENIMHGKASGGDPTTVIYGGFVRFQKINGEFNFEQLKIKEGVVPEVFLIDSGKPVESTGEMVGIVNSKLHVNWRAGQRPRRASETENPKVKKIIKEMGALSKEFVEELGRGSFRTDLIKENSRLLGELGVVGRRARKMISEIESIGGVGKISGAGGVKGGSGVLLAFHEDGRKMRSLIKRQGWKSFSSELGVEGWKVES